MDNKEFEETILRRLHPFSLKFDLIMNTMGNDRDGVLTSTFIENRILRRDGVGFGNAGKLVLDLSCDEIVAINSTRNITPV